MFPPAKNNVTGYGFGSVQQLQLTHYGYDRKSGKTEFHVSFYQKTIHILASGVRTQHRATRADGRSIHSYRTV